MAISDSTFLLDISIAEMKRLDPSEYKCKMKFSNLVELYLLDLEELEGAVITRPVIDKTNTIRQKKKKEHIWSYRGLRKEFGQTFILINRNNHIVLDMEKHDLELSLWSKTNPDVKIGMSVVPWTQHFYNYVKNIINTPRLSPVVHKKTYNVVNAQRSCLGSIKVIVKLICTSSSIYRYISCSKDNVRIYGNLFSNPEIIVKLFQHKIKRNNFELENGILTCRLENQSKIEDADKVTGSFVNKRTNLNEKEPIEIEKPKKYNAFDYIFGDPNEHLKNKVYCVNYFTVIKNASTKSDTSVKSATQTERLAKSNRQFVNKTHSNLNINSRQLLDTQSDIASSYKITNCKEIFCDSRVHRKPPIKTKNDTPLLDFTSIHTECCKVQKFNENLELVEGEVSAKINYSDDQCYCSCECEFDFTRTRYCKICGGYEIVGDDLANKTALDMPMPCPIFHKLVDKNKLKTLSTSGSESRSKLSKIKLDESLRSIKSSTKVVSDKILPVSDKKIVESEKDSKKENNVIKHQRIQFTYAYKAPHIGHYVCAAPCKGMQHNVPKSMGWFWTAGYLPGTRFRPMWKPGAINKQVLRKLRLAKNAKEVVSKKKKKDISKVKRPIKRPLLTVHKVDGEYTVKMETMKIYNRPRAIHQQPYDDKPALTYTIGRTEEENRHRQKKRDKEQRRLEREKRVYLQSAFKNMCHEICMKTYQQALGILPNAEEPGCTCYAPPPIGETTSMNLSCSCSEDSSASDTDCDEWLVEFTPPNALYDPSMKGKKSQKTDNSTQYTYLDYRVKLVDRFGNVVPRFFKGPDGKEQCSDLGGFFSPDHKWLEINVDGFIGPDGRWAPNSFIGPNGEQVEAATGKFQDRNLQWLVVGVDGYVNAQGKWRFYSKYQGAAIQKKRPAPKTLSKHTTKKTENVLCKSEASWSCFGDVTHKQLSRLGISGHGRDRKFLMLKLKDQGQNTVPRKTQKPAKKGKTN